MNPKALAHGRAAHSVLRYLHGRDVPDVALRKPIDHAAGPEPHGQEAIEAAIMLAIVEPAAEMMHLGATPRYLQRGMPAVDAAIRHASRLGGDEIDHLERCLDDALACLKSPKVRHAVAALAGALLRSPRGDMVAADVERTIILALAEQPPDADGQEPHPRRIYVR